MPRVSAILVALTALVVTGCGSGAKPTTPSTSAEPATIRVSSDFSPGAAIPRAHTCDGADVSPPVRAVGLPAASREVVMVMRDPDAPGGDFIHWNLAGLEATRGTLILPVAAKPAGAILGRNSYGSLGYRGPCPPAGAAHHYQVTVYAVGQPSGLRRGFTAGEVSALPILGQGTLTGTYARP